MAFKMPYSAGIIGSLNGVVELEIAGTEPTDEEIDKMYDMAMEQCSSVSCASLDIDIFLER